MSNYYVLGNWKSNGSQASLKAFETAFSQCTPAANPACNWGFALPYHLLPQTAFANAWCGGQNVSSFGAGAYTGEIHAQMLTELGCQFCLVGHSERRQYLSETPQDTGKKLGHLLESGILPVLCIGETLPQREAGELADVLTLQLEPLRSLEASHRIVIAYEPVWAIGTGVAASVADVAKTHELIREMLNGLGFSNTPILYGGSVKPANAAELAALEDVGGFLVGGASLKADAFSTIITGFLQSKGLVPS